MPLCLLGALPGVILAQGRVWRVAPSGGDFTQIAPAVGAANSGDVILVTTAPTPYAGFEARGKSLTIMSADAGKPQVLGQTDVWELPPGGAFKMVNLRFRGTDGTEGRGPSAYALTCSSNPTTPPVTFVLSGCDVETGRWSWPSASPYPIMPVAALYVDGGGRFTANASQLVLLDRVRAVATDEARGLLAGAVQLVANECVFHGGDAVPPGRVQFALIHSGPGAWIGDGSYWFNECQMRGGSVPAQTPGRPQNGGAGLVAGAYTTNNQSADLFVTGRRTTIAGGNSSDLIVGGRGGYGLDLPFTSSQVYVDGQPFVGGMTLAGTIGQVPAVFGTPPPLPRNLGSSSFDRALVDLGTQTTLRLTARPQEPHLLLASGGARTMSLPGILEPLPILGTPNWFPMALLVTDTAGRAALQFGIPADPLLSSQTLFVQGIGLDLTTQLVVDSLCSVTLR